MAEPVILKPQPLGTFNNTNYLEPQMIQERSNNTALIFLDSVTNKLELNKANMQISTISAIGDQASTLIQGITRLKVRSFGINFIVPNVNPRNNSVVFYSSITGGTPWNVIIPEGVYTSPVSLMAALVTALNSISFSTGLTFTATPLTSQYGPTVYSLTSVGGNYIFDLNSKAIKFGFPLWNLPIDQVFSNSKIVGSIGLQYTRWVDICSNTLNRHVKTRNISNNGVNNIVYRIYIDPNPLLPFQFSSQPNIPAFNYNNQEPANIIDFQLIDEFGEIIYVPPVNNQLGFWWNITLFAEI